VLVLAALAVLLMVPTSSAEFGWFAYAPLTDTVVMSGSFSLLDPTHRWAVAIGVTGLIAASWAAGFLAGRRAT
jgi:heme/copper-type cytochrome/quinol oxidase subunit 1